MNIAIILSGGVGSRMGIDMPKQYVEVEGMPVLGYSLAAFAAHPDIDAIVVAVADQWRDFVAGLASRLCPEKPVSLAPAGQTRQYSIFNALEVAARSASGDADLVIVHDGARPLVGADLIGRCLAACSAADAVMPAIAVKDTTYLSDDGTTITALLDRSKLWAGQAPEAFRLAKYLAAHRAMDAAELMKINGSTELAFKSGLSCRIIEGDPMNFKITTPEDLSNFKTIIKARKK